jgi:outer membrane protein assembly factor BamA
VQANCTAPEGESLLEPRIHVLGSAVQQDFLHPGVKAELAGGYDFVTLEGYLEQGPLAQLNLSSALGWSRLQGSVGWKFAYYSFDNFVPALSSETNQPGDPRTVLHAQTAEDPTLAATLNIDHPEQLGAFTQNLELDLRDNPVEPTTGAYAQLKLAEGTVAAGGKLDYFQLTPDVRGYLSLGDTVFAVHARFGAIFGDVPATERYYLGGASSQRGFADRHLSPEAHQIDPNDWLRGPLSNGYDITRTGAVPIGGAGMIETGIEVRRHWEPFGLKAGWVAFLDGGDVTMTPEDLDITHLHWAVGAGLRLFYLPIGPIRFELARRLNRTGYSDPSDGQLWNFILSVGEAF